MDFDCSRSERLIEAKIANRLHRKVEKNEAIFVNAYYILDKDGKRVYDMEMIRQEFEENILILIDLNKQKGLSDGKTT